MAIRILAFGPTGDIIGQQEITLAVVDTDALKEQLLQQYTGLKDVQFAIAVNRKVVNGKTMLIDGDTVALLPPFSGG